VNRGRSMARRYAMQALYQWQMTGQDVEEIIDQYMAEQDMRKADTAYFEDLLRHVVLQAKELEGQLQPFLDRPVYNVDPVESAILRMSTYELMAHPDVPFRVVINEAVELAKMFGATNSHKYVNGILDKVAIQLRSAEVNDKKKEVTNNNGKKGIGV